ncbi:MAG: helix-turn-helix transcriptional regulator [Anaerolineae bacterium]|nr:helix-turn-helix transcriptional regulator [Anaerolineae bacterium]
MSVRLVILGFLRDHDLYGYEIKQLIEGRMGDWTSIAFGSIYHALGKLADEGLIEKIATEQEGGRPSRTVYRITESGEREFMNLLRGIWQNVERVFYTIDLGLFFMNALRIDEVKGYVQQRIGHLEAVLAHLETHRAEALPAKPYAALADAIFDHSVGQYEAELAWTRELLARIENGDLP